MKVIIVGAGTSGWLTASALKRNCPEMDITMVYDSSMPTVGVGETLSFALPGFMRNTLGLQDEQWMRDVQATYKTGLWLYDWTAPGSVQQIRHITDFPTDVLLESSLDSIAQLKNYADQDSHDRYATRGGIVDVWYTLFRKGELGNDYNHLMSSLSEAYHFGSTAKSHRDGDGNWLTNQYTGYSYHYNAENVSNVVGNLVGRPAGVKEIDSRVVDVVTDNGIIKELKLANGNTVTADLYIDCSGFKRLLVSALPYTWQDCDEFYNNSAIVKQIPYSDKDHPAHRITNSTTLAAMDAGWRFSVPLQNRSGNGYVFNSRTNPDIDKLYDEFESKVQSKNPGVYRLIKWNPGYYEKAAVGNCIALGLASGFTDPYDANNLNLTCTLVTDIIQEVRTNPDWRYNLVNFTNYKSELYWEDVDMRVQSSLRLSPRRDTEHYRLMADVAEQTRLRERFAEHIVKIRQRDYSTARQHLWPVWTHILVALRNGVEFPCIDVDPMVAEVAKHYFDYNNVKYKLKAQLAPSEKEFYQSYKEIGI